MLLTAAPARAYEDKLTVGVEAGYAAVVVESDLPTHGFALGLASSIGLDDIWSVRAHVAWAYHPGSRDLHVGILGAEILYLVDIVQLVPFFGAGIDLLGTVFDGTAGIEAGVHIVLGLEYLLSRDALVAFEVRPHFLPLAIVEDGRLDPIYITAGVRGSLLFDI